MGTRSQYLLLKSDQLTPQQIQTLSAEIAARINDEHIDATIVANDENNTEKIGASVCAICVEIFAEAFLRETAKKIVNILFDVIQDNSSLRVEFRQNKDTYSGTPPSIPIDLSSFNNGQSSIVEKVVNSFGDEKNQNQERQSLVVGISNYADPKIRNLKYAASDAKRVAGLLQNQELCGFSTHEIKRKRTRKNILIKLENMVKRLSSDALFLFYYSGHGFTDKEGRLYLSAEDTDTENIITTAISIDNIIRVFEQSNCRKIVIILDCCFAGNAAVELGAEKNYFDTDLKERVSGITKEQFWICGSEKDVAAFENSFHKSSVFSKYFVEGIEFGEADLNKDGLVSIEEISAYIRQKMGSESAHQSSDIRLNTSGKNLIISQNRKELLKRQHEENAAVIEELHDNKFIDKSTRGNWLAFSSDYSSRHSSLTSKDDKSLWNTIRKLSENEEFYPSEAVTAWNKITAKDNPKRSGKFVSSVLGIFLAIAVLALSVVITRHGTPGDAFHDHSHLVAQSLHIQAKDHNSILQHKLSKNRVELNKINDELEKTNVKTATLGISLKNSRAENDAQKKRMQILETEISSLQDLSNKWETTSAELEASKKEVSTLNQGLKTAEAKNQDYLKKMQVLEAKAMNLREFPEKWERTNAELTASLAKIDRLNNSLSKALNENNDYAKQVQILEAKAKSLQEFPDKWRQTNAELLALKTQAGVLDQKLKSAEVKNQNYLKEVEALQSKAARLEGYPEKWQKTRTELEASLAKVAALNQSLKIEINEKRDYAKQVEVLGEQAASLEEFPDKLKAATAELAKSRAKIDALGKELHDAETTKDGYLNDVKSLEAEITQLRKQKAQDSDLLEQRERELEDTKSKFDFVSAELREATGNNNKLQRLVSFGPGALSDATGNIEVKELQNQLFQSGCYLGYIDGDAGNATIEGLRRSVGESAADKMENAYGNPDEYQRVASDILNENYGLFEDCDPKEVDRPSLNLERYISRGFGLIRGRFPKNESRVQLEFDFDATIGKRLWLVDAISNISEYRVVYEVDRENGYENFIEMISRGGGYSHDFEKKGKFSVEIEKRDDIRGGNFNNDYAIFVTTK